MSIYAEFTLMETNWIDKQWLGLSWIDWSYTLKTYVYEYLRTLQYIMYQVKEILKTRNERVKCQPLDQTY
jgi:hypothetical protein